MPAHDPENLPDTLGELIHLFKRVFDAGEEKFDHRVSRYLPAEALKKALDISIGAEGCSEAQIVRALQDYLHYTPKTWRAEFNKLLFSGMDRPALLADWVSSLSNTTMHTYQVAPVATLMEQELVAKLNQLIGFDAGDGIMVSGGSMANMLAMLLARHRKSPDIKQHGYTGAPLVAYVSELAHYSYEKAANLLGIGTQNLISVSCDQSGCLRPDALNAAIRQSLSEQKQPFFIGLTAGTTVIGSFDPVAACAEIAQLHGLWLHVDAAWGGPVLFSDTHRALLPDSAMADSFTWDAHKLMSIPLAASLILVKDHHSLLDACAGGGGAYLFHENENAAYDLGNKSLQCGRRVDALKFWLSWKAQGHTGYAQKVDRLMALKDYMLDKISSIDEFERLAPAAYLNVLFRYKPARAMSEKQLEALNIAICNNMLQQDLGFVDYAHYRGTLGIRFILANAELTQAHIDRFLENCRQIGHQLSAV